MDILWKAVPAASARQITHGTLLWPHVLVHLVSARAGTRNVGPPQSCTVHSFIRTVIECGVIVTAWNVVALRSTRGAPNSSPKALSKESQASLALSTVLNPFIFPWGPR